MTDVDRATTYALYRLLKERGLAPIWDTDFHEIIITQTPRTVYVYIENGTLGWWSGGTINQRLNLNDHDCFEQLITILTSPDHD
jgi:hypothetical protein